MAPAPAPAPATPSAAVPAVGVEVESARNQNNKLVVKSEDVSSIGGLNDDGDLPIPCAKPAGTPEVAPMPVEYKGGDTTESSSSFGDTFSGFGDEADDGEPEVTSHSLSPTDEAGSSRRKKVTAEWKNAVRPVMWRCQWLQLRVKDLVSQVSRYDRELALIEKAKEPQQADGKTTGSLPDAMLIGKDHRNSSMMRIKRKRHEDTEDTSLYIKKHKILSYYNDNKQNKGGETDGLLLDDDCVSSGGPDTVALLDDEEYDVIFEQVSLNDILSTIDAVKSRVHFLQDRLNKAHLQEENSTFSEDDTQVRVPRKRQSTQKFCDTSYMKHQSTKSLKYRNAKPQKKKNLNILLKDDEPALAVKPSFPDSGTNCRIEDAKGYSGGKSGEWNHSEDRAVAMNLLLGVDNSLPNGHMGDLCKENADDILIDNQTANEGGPQFEKIEHLPSVTLYSENTCAPVEVMKASAPPKVNASSSALKADGTCATVFNQEPLLEKSLMLKPVKKRDWKPRERKDVWGSASSALNHSKGASATPDSEHKAKDAPPSATVKTESTPTASVEPEIIMMTPLAAWKKRKSGNKSAALEEHKDVNSTSKKQKSGMLAGNKSAALEEHKDVNSKSKKQKSGTSVGNKSAAPEEHEVRDSASKNQKTGKSSSSATKKRKAEYSPSAVKQETENSSPAAKTQETKSRAVLVTLNSRRSQRIRKPKVY